MADINQVSARAISKTCALSDELAQEIVRTRRRHGPFRCVEDLWKVEGMTTTAVGVLSSMYHMKLMINTDSDTFTTQSEKERYGSRSTNCMSSAANSEDTDCKEGNVEKVELDNEKEMISIAVKNVHGKDHNTLARTAHVQKSPSGHTLYIKCEGIREYHITGVNPINGVRGTSSGARADSDARTQLGNNIRKSKIDKAFHHPIYSRRNHLRGEFSKTKFEFWNRIEKGRKDLEKRMHSPRVNPTAKWIHCLPNNVDINPQNSFYDPPSVQNASVTSKQNSSPERLHTGRSRGRKDGKSKSRERKRTADAGEVNAKNFDSLENVAGTSKQRPSRKTRSSLDRKKKSSKNYDKKKSRHEHKKDKTHHSRDRKKSHHSRGRKKSDRKDREKKKTRGNKTETSDEGFCIIL